MDNNVYKFTFEDGSESFMHYGVKGMKWGQHLFGKADELASHLQRAAGEGASAVQGGVNKALGILNGTSGGIGGYNDDENLKSLDSVKENVEKLLAEQEGESDSQETVKALTDEQVTDLAYEVIRGEWGNGEERYEALQDEGYSYAKVQTKVNDIIYGTNDYEEGRNTSGREDREQSSPQVHEEPAEEAKTSTDEEAPKKKRIG